MSDHYEALQVWVTGRTIPVDFRITG